MIQVRSLEITSTDRPSQWEGLSEDGSIYIRYRRGELEVYVSETSDAAGGELIFNTRIGDKYDGQLSTEKMKVALSEICQFID